MAITFLSLWLADCSGGDIQAEVSFCCLGEQCHNYEAIMTIAACRLLCGNLQLSHYLARSLHVEKYELLVELLRSLRPDYTRNNSPGHKVAGRRFGTISRSRTIRLVALYPHDSRGTLYGFNDLARRSVPRHSLRCSTNVTMHELDRRFCQHDRIGEMCLWQCLQDSIGWQKHIPDSLFQWPTWFLFGRQHYWPYCCFRWLRGCKRSNIKVECWSSLHRSWPSALSLRIMDEMSLQAHNTG